MMRSTTFSATISVGQCRLPLVTLGMMEASTTRRFCTPCTRPSVSTTDISSDPIRQLDAGWYCVELFALSHPITSTSDILRNGGDPPSPRSSSHAGCWMISSVNFTAAIMTRWSSGSCR